MPTQPVILDAPLVHDRVQGAKFFVGNTGVAHHQTLWWNVLDEAIHQNAERDAVREVVYAAKATVACNSMPARKFAQASS